MSNIIRLETADEIAVCDDSAALLESLRDCASDLLKNLSRMAAILRRLDELGVEVSVNHALLPYVRMIAQGKLTAGCFLTCSGDPLLLDMATRLSGALQEKIANNEPFKMLTADDEHRMVRPLEMGRRELVQVFTTGGRLRTEDEQAARLKVPENKPVAHRNYPPLQPDTLPRTVSIEHASDLETRSLSKEELPNLATTSVGRCATAMDADTAESTARRVMIHLYRGSIEQARASLEDGWRSHIQEQEVLPEGQALLDEPLARVLDDVRMLNTLEDSGIDTIGGLLESTDGDLYDIPNLGHNAVTKLHNLRVGMRARANAEATA